MEDRVLSFPKVYDIPVLLNTVVSYTIEKISVWLYRLYLCLPNFGLAAPLINTTYIFM